MQTSPPGFHQRQWLTQFMLAGLGRELDDQQLLAIEAPANAVGLGDVGTAGRSPPQHAHHLCVGVVCEVDEGRREARGQCLLHVQAFWGRKGVLGGSG